MSFLVLEPNLAQNVHNRSTEGARDRHSNHPRVDNVPEEAPVDSLLLLGHLEAVLFVISSSPVGIRAAPISTAGHAHEHNRSHLTMRRRDGNTDLAGQQHSQR